MNILVLRALTVREGGCVCVCDKIQFQCFILYMTIPEPVKSLPDEVGSDEKEGGELQPPLTFVEQSQTEIFEEDPEVENEAASKEADGNEPIEHAAATIDNAIAAASIENEGKYIM